MQDAEEGDDGNDEPSSSCQSAATTAAMKDIGHVGCNCQLLHLCTHGLLVAAACWLCGPPPTHPREDEPLAAAARGRPRGRSTRPGVRGGKRHFEAKQNKRAAAQVAEGGAIIVMPVFFIRMNVCTGYKRVCVHVC